MEIANAWALAYARQADRDFQAWNLYQTHPNACAAECHRLLFLQMACEKLCKAFLIQAGTDPAHAQSSHAYIARPLPLIIREEMQEQRLDIKKMAWLQTHIRRIANEIELLSPAVDRDGRRPDNCEYPWRIGAKVFSPLDATFIPSDLLSQSAGRTFLKLLRAAVDRVLRQAQGKR